MGTTGRSNGKPMSVSPLFFLAKDAPEGIDRVDVLEAAEKVTKNPAAVICATRSGGLWKLYAAALDHKATLKTQGHLNMQNKNTKVCKNVKLYVQNPYNLRSENGEEIPGTRLNIDGLPLSVSDEDLMASLQEQGVKTRGNLVWEKVRKRDDTLHPHWITGRRYIFIDLPKVSLSSKLKVGSFTCYMNYKEQDKPKQTCHTCGLEGHRKYSPLCKGPPMDKHKSAAVDRSDAKIKCYTCGKEGHKQFSPLCQGAPKEVTGPLGTEAENEGKMNVDKLVEEVMDSIWDTSNNVRPESSLRVEMAMAEAECKIVDELLMNVVETNLTDLFDTMREQDQPEASLSDKMAMEDVENKIADEQLLNVVETNLNNLPVVEEVDGGEEGHELVDEETRGTPFSKSAHNSPAKVAEDEMADMEKGLGMNGDELEEVPKESVEVGGDADSVLDSSIVDEQDEKLKVEWNKLSKSARKRLLKQEKKKKEKQKQIEKVQKQNEKIQKPIDECFPSVTGTSSPALDTLAGKRSIFDQNEGRMNDRRKTLVN